MATKKKPATDANVTRIKASDTSASAKKSDTKTKETKKPVEKTAGTETKVKKSRKGAFTRPFRAIGSYFKGAWVELRQVRWPTRRATWGMTGAVLAFSAFFVVVVLLLDAGFKYAFELLLGK